MTRAVTFPPEPQWLDRPNGDRLAYHIRNADGDGPGLLWLGGFNSDMGGTKALALDAWAEESGTPMVRFDYFGHGQSTGAFAQGTISQWKDDALAVIDALLPGPFVLVGSSMGGWIALLAALAQPERVKGLVLIAPAPDFTERLMWDQFSDEVRREIEQTGQWLRPSAYGDPPYPITKRLIDDGRQNLLLNAESIDITAPVRILQGMNDEEVPWRHALELCEKLTSKDIAMTLVKHGDHRLSSPDDLTRLIATVDHCRQLASS